MMTGTKMKKHVPFTISPSILKGRQRCHKNKCHKCSINFELGDIAILYGSKHYIAHLSCYNELYIDLSDDGIEDIIFIEENNNSLSPLVHKEVD